MNEEFLKQLSDSVIKLVEIVKETRADNAELRKEVDTLKSGVTKNTKVLPGGEVSDDMKTYLKDNNSPEMDKIMENLKF